MSPKVRPNNYGFGGKMYRGYDTAMFAMLYLILLTLWFHKTFKLIFLNQSSWPKTMYAEHWRKLAWATFLGNFPILLVQQPNMILFPIEHNFWPVILTFYFDLVPRFYFLKWNRFFSSFIPVLCEHVTTSTTYYHGKFVLIYKLKDSNGMQLNC